MKAILVIEDEVNILRGLRDILKFEGYDVITETDGHKGLQLALEKSPDLLLLDLMLPGLNGYDICRKAKAQKPGLPIIMLTVRGQEVDKIVGLDLGADESLSASQSLWQKSVQHCVAIKKKEKKLMIILSVMSYCILKSMKRL